MFKKPTLIILVLFIFAAVGLFAFRLNNEKTGKVENASITPTSAVAEESITYTSQTHGYKINIPNGYEISESTADEVAIVGPDEGSGRGVVWINTEAANGRSAKQVVDKVVAGLDQDYKVNIREIKLDETPALIVSPLPGQDVTRQIFLVHGETLYRLTFTPDDPQLGKAYEQMEKAYKMIIASFRFTK